MAVKSVWVEVQAVRQDGQVVDFSIATVLKNPPHKRTGLFVRVDIEIDPAALDLRALLKIDASDIMVMTQEGRMDA